MDATSDLQVASDTQSKPAMLEFLADWQERQIGVIRAGGKLVIHYDPSRLPYCRLNWRGAEVWDIEVFLRFHPTEELIYESVLERIRDDMYGMVIRLEPRSVEVDVPHGARQVELWCRNWYQVSSICETWDSRYGQNYWFQVEVDPEKSE